MPDLTDVLIELEQARTALTCVCRELCPMAEAEPVNPNARIALDRARTALFMTEGTTERLVNH